MKVPPASEREGLIFDALRMGNTRRAAFGIAGITATTFYRMMEDVTFQDAVVKAEAEAEATFAALVAEAAAKGPSTWQAAAWWLERRRHEDFGRRDRVDMVVDVRREAERIALAEGLDSESVMAEATRILAGQ
jgi:hypothetical protein